MILLQESVTLAPSVSIATRLLMLLLLLQESFVEDINSILNNGEVPNIFPADERAALVSDMAGIAKKQGVYLRSKLSVLISCA